LIETKEPVVDLKHQSNNLQELEISKIPSPVLARLIEEVRNEEMSDATAYNRMHNRHNRSR